MPKTINSKLAVVSSRRGNTFWIWSLSTRMMADPSKAPHTCAAPPTTAMNRYSMP